MHERVDGADLGLFGALDRDSEALGDILAHGKGEAVALFVRFLGYGCDRNGF